ncbi:hypothetical protein OG909_24695 [Streptomyces sp. NBC_01754]|uniref:hypothetical protein n=1 Tax=Streptomyces sp. NBC_01754 TaxID=2975930 RepID=UPI002DDC40D9|nr:hypothetical protein [Streptomyces sp. NBC_01754]WSC95214.1 hypothetical protein OG909_24695 [Streptomyces sp. NBC_01754]
MATLNFVLQGRDALSRTLNSAGDSAERLRRRMNDAADDSARAIAGFTRDADGSLRDLQGNLISTDEALRRLRAGATSTDGSFADLNDRMGRFGGQLKSSWISLVPAAIPMAAGLAGAAAAVTAQLGAAGVAAGAYALALGPQIGAIMEAREAHGEYEAAVEESGAASQAAAAAQVKYQRRLEELPPETRKAAAAVGLLSDAYGDWADDLSDDVMQPFIKGIAVTNALLPKTTSLVKGTSTQFDRLITLVGAGVTSPGFDRLNDRFTAYTEKTLRSAVDGTVSFFATLDQREVGGGMKEFFDYCRDAGPVVGDTLRNVGEAVIHLLDGASGVGVGMLDLVNALSAVVAAVPPEAISAMLQAAIAIKAIRLAAAGAAAGRAALAAIAGQLVLMRTAAAGAPGRLAGVSAAISTLSKTAKLAVAGTGIGLLLVLLAELSQSGKATAPDVDKLSTSLGKFAQTGKVTGEAASAFGKDFGKLRDQIDRVLDPSLAESFNNWGSKWTRGLLSGGEAAEKLTESLDSIDTALAGMVSAGKADLAAKAIKGMVAKMDDAQAKKFTDGLGDYQAAVEAARFESKLAAEAQGLFGAQALEVQASLKAQKDSADGLRQSIQALNDVQRAGLGGMIAFEAAIDAASKAAEENGRVLDMTRGKLTLTTEKQRTAATALSDLAEKTDAATAAARESGSSWAEVSGIYDRGRAAFIRSAKQMGLNKDEAKKLADQIMKTPDKTAYLKGDVADLKAKLVDAKERLEKAPSSKTASIKGEISDLKQKIASAKTELAGMDGKTATAYIKVRTLYFKDNTPGPYAPGYMQGGPIRRAAGGPIPGYPGGGHLQGPGTSTSDSILLWGSTGEYMVKASSVEKYGLKFMDALNDGRLPVGRSAPAAGLPAVAAASGAQTTPGQQVTYNVYPRSSVIGVEDLRLIQRQEEARQRVGRPR